MYLDAITREQLKEQTKYYDILVLYNMAQEEGAELLYALSTKNLPFSKDWSREVREEFADFYIMLRKIVTKFGYEDTRKFLALHKKHNEKKEENFSQAVLSLIIKINKYRRESNEITESNVIDTVHDILEMMTAKINYLKAFNGEDTLESITDIIRAKVSRQQERMILERTNNNENLDILGGNV